MLTVVLQPEIEARFRDDAAKAGLAPEQLAAQRLQEADLLWRIKTATPSQETRELHSLLRRRRAGTLSASQERRLRTMLDERENKSAQRLKDLADLARLRSTPVRQLMDQLGIHPLATP